MLWFDRCLIYAVDQTNKLIRSLGVQESILVKLGMVSASESLGKYLNIASARQRVKAFSLTSNC